MPQERFIDVNGVRLHVVLAGPESGPLAILLHGFPEFWYGWRRQIAPLAEAGFRVMVPDQRGYNTSDKPAGVHAYRLDVLADDVIGMIDFAGRDRAVLIGHDWGAAVGWWTAVRHPHRVAGLIVLNVAHPLVLLRYLRHSLRQMLKSSYMFWFLVPRLPEALMRIGAHRPMFASIRRTARPEAFGDEDEEPYRHAWSQPGALTGMVNWYRALLRYPPRSASPRVAVPTLVVWGERERFAQLEMAHESLELCDRGELVVIRGATHWVHHEEAGRVNALLLEFASASNR